MFFSTRIWEFFDKEDMIGLGKILTSIFHYAKFVNETSHISHKKPYKQNSRKNTFPSQNISQQQAGLFHQL